MSILSHPENRARSLVNGDRMAQAEFHRRYESCPEDEKWELLQRDSRRLLEVLEHGLASRPHASFVKRMEAAHRRRGAE